MLNQTEWKSQLNLGLFTLLHLSIVYINAQSQQVSLVSCLRGSTATEIIATVRAKINGADITELTTYDTGGNPQTNPACTTDTITNDFLQLTLTFDETSPTCGIVQDTAPTSRFNIIVHAKGTSLDQPYNLYCDNTDLTEDVVTTGEVGVNGQIGQFGFPERIHDVKLQAAFAGSDLPVTETEIGREIYFRLVYNKGSGNIANTNWGRKFHVGFLKTTPGATLSLNIYGPAHGSRVRVKGMLPGFVIDETITLTRDIPVDFTGTIASDYQPSSVLSNWIVEPKGLEIAVVGSDDPVGVRVNSENGAGYVDSYVAYPDELLAGTLYLLPTLPVAGASQAQAVIVATEDGTSLTVTKKGGAVTFPGGGTTLSVSLDNFDTYHMFCDVSCEGASISTDKPVAVVTGNGQVTLAPGTLPGHLMTPILPAANFGQKFVLINVRNGLSTQTHYKVLHNLPDFSTQINWLHDSGPTELDNGDNPVVLTAAGDTYAAEEFEVDPAANGGNPPYAVVTQFLTGTGVLEPAMVSLPPVELWSTELVIPVKSNVDYDFVVVSTKDDVGAIVFSTNTVASQTLDAFATVTDVTPHTGTIINYGMIALTFTILPADKWMKFETLDKTKPLMVLAYEVLGSGSVQAYGPFGQRVSTVVGCVPAPPQTNLPVYPGVRSGDGIDNDCDGKADEELMNGEDDDGDLAVDEDVAPGDPVGNKAIYNIGLEMSEDEDFTAPTAVIGGDGCNVVAANNVISTIGRFTASSADNIKYPHHWTLRTNTFGAVRFRNTKPVWVKATVGFCDDEADLCIDSCGAKRKRRDTADTRKPETVYLQFNVKSYEKNQTAKTTENDNSCWHDVTFWSMVYVLLAMILTEVILIAVFSTKKSNLLIKLKPYM